MNNREIAAVYLEADNTIGWIVALIITFAVIVAAFVLIRRNTPPPLVADTDYTIFVMKCNMHTGACIVDR